MAEPMKYELAMRAERMVDCYGGESCEEYVPYWWMYAEGDKDSDSTHGPLTLDAKDFPPGTRVTVEYPACPRCEHTMDLCKCGFDWKQWVEDKYA